MRFKGGLLLFLILSPAAFAAGGSWTQKGAGGSLSVGNQIMTSRVLSPPAGVSIGSFASSVSWQIQLLSPPPYGLKIKLCTPKRCIRLPGLSGTLTVKEPLEARADYRFIYSVETRGQLRPTLHVISNHLTVNYR